MSYSITAYRLTFSPTLLVASTGHLIRRIFSVFLAAEPFPGLVHAGVGEDPAWEVGEGYRHTGTIITSAVCQTAVHPEAGSQALTHL